MTNAGPERKKCPKCKQVDTTTFSSCRSCGTKYDYKEPEKVKDSSFNIIPVILVAGFVIVGVSVWQVMQVNSLYKRPDQLIGKTVACKGNLLVAAADKSNLLSLPEGDYKGLNHFGQVDASSDANTLNSLAAMSSDISLFQKYANDSRITMIRREAGDPPFSVKVVAATAPSDKYTLAEVEFLNGPKTGTMWWIDSSKLDLSIKNK